MLLGLYMCLAIELHNTLVQFHCCFLNAGRLQCANHVHSMKYQTTTLSVADNEQCVQAVPVSL